MAGRSTSVPRKRIDQTHPPDEETAVCTSFFVSRFVSFRFVFFYFFFRCFSSVRRFPPLAFRRRAGAATGGFPGGLSFSPIWHYNNRRLFLWENKDLGKSGHRCWFTRVRWHSMTLHFIYLEETEIKKKSLTQSQWVELNHLSLSCEFLMRMAPWNRLAGVNCHFITLHFSCARVRVCVCVWVCVCFSVRFLSSFNFGSGPRISSAFLLAGPITKVPMATRNTCRRGVGGGGGGGGGACLRTAPPSWPQPAPPIFRFRLAVLPDFRTRLFFFAGIGGLDAPPRGRHGTRHSKLGKTR